MFHITIDPIREDDDNDNGNAIDNDNDNDDNDDADDYDSDNDKAIITIPLKYIESIRFENVFLFRYKKSNN